MNYKIDFTAKAPAYLQLYEFLKNDIIAGVYPLGSRLPSKRTIAADTGVSVITASHAIGLLCEEGYAEARERSGFFVIYQNSDFNFSQTYLLAQKNTISEKNENPIQTWQNTIFERTKASILARQNNISERSKKSIQIQQNNIYERSENSRQVRTDIISGEIQGIHQTQENNAPEFPYTVLSRTMRKVLSEYGERILIKSPNHGCPELRGELCAYLARSRGIFVTPPQVIIGSGAEYLYGLIAQLLGTDRTYAIEDPSYEKIRRVYGSFGAKCEPLPLTEQGIPSKLLNKTTASVLHVTPFHSFPSGITVSISKKQEYIGWAQKKNGWLIEDNYDSELTVSKKAEDSLFSLAGGSQVIYINTFSKTIAPSMRIGYMVIPETMIDEFERRLGFYSCTVPVFEQYVLAELIKNGDFERNINRIRRRRRKNIQN